MSPKRVSAVRININGIEFIDTMKGIVRIKVNFHELPIRVQ